jgi:hypothetical protein
VSALVNPGLLSSSVFFHFLLAGPKPILEPHIRGHSSLVLYQFGKTS